MKNWTRKEFLKAAATGIGFSYLAGHSRLYGAVGTSGSANGDIRVAVVGLNQQGGGHMRTYLPGTKDAVRGARLVALCDVDTEVLARRKAQSVELGVTPETYVDYRKLLENKNIDAVVLATPNHQHSLQTIWALQAGKDVYCEKPLSHNVWEGRQVLEAEKKYTKNIAYMGTQNRSSEDILEAMAVVNSGRIGKITCVRGLCYKERLSIGKTTGPQPVPEHIDYDLWSGPAPLTPPRRNSKNGTVHYDWHWFWNYGGGDITNQGIHQMDVARWFLGEEGLPPTVMSFGGRFSFEDDAETPNTLVSVFGYKKAPLIFEVRGLPMKTGMRAMDAYRGVRVGVVVQCENGYVAIGGGGGAVIYDNQNKPIEKFARNTMGQHRQNFVTAMQTRKVTNATALDSHLSSALCHLGNVSYMLGTESANQVLAEAVKNDADTNDSFARTMDHLKANEVNTDITNTVVGPLLRIDRATEMFTGGEKVITDNANGNPLRKRTGRQPFTIPEFKV